MGFWIMCWGVMSFWCCWRMCVLRGLGGMGFMGMGILLRRGGLGWVSMGIGRGWGSFGGWGRRWIIGGLIGWMCRDGVMKLMLKGISFW